MESKVYQVKFLINAHGFEKKLKGIVLADTIEEAKIGAEDAVLRTTKDVCEHARYSILDIKEIECCFIISKRRKRNLAEELLGQIKETDIKN